MADQLWRQFRSWPLWAQIAGWFFGFWILVPLLIWRTSWHPGAKAAVTAAFLLFVGSVALAEPTTPPTSPTVAEEREDIKPTPEEAAEATREDTPTPEPIATTPPEPAVPGVASRVTRVVDGDTIEARYEGQVVDIRLIGIDTPETVHPSEPVGCLGREASAFTKRQLDGSRIRLEFDVQRTDRYGRTLAYVWLGEKVFNEQIVAKGFAKVSTYPPNVKYEDRFIKAQRKARKNNRGLWAPDACPEPAPPQPVTGGSGNCDANYKGTCVPVVNYDLDCGDISGSVQVVGEDKHGFDSDGDGYGCESN